MKKYWDKFTDRFGLTILHPQLIISLYKRDAVNAAKKYSKNKSLIDIGCGRMPYRSILAPVVKKYVGVDHPNISKLYDSQIKPEIFADITQEIPVKNSSFDVALMFEVLEYLKNPTITFSELNRILKRNGVLIMTTPFLYPLHDIPYDRNRFTNTQIKSFLNESGFKIKRIQTNGSFIEHLFLSLNVFLMKRIMDILKFRKTPILIIYLAILLIVTPPIILITNSIILFTRQIKLNLPNYFPIDYMVVATKQ